MKARVLAAMLAAAVLWMLPPARAGAVPASPAFGPMIDSYASYEGQSRCAPRPKRGVRAFRSLILSAYPGTGAGSISRPCSVGGRSEHKEGRAWDWGVRASVASERAAAEDVIDWLLAKDEFGNRHAMARRVGIMYLIYNRRIWSPWGGWETYCVQERGLCRDPDDGGVRHPHDDHVHFSFSWAGARKKTSFFKPKRSLVAASAASSGGSGLWLAGREGAVITHGTAPYLGSVDGTSVPPITAVAPSPTGGGYYLLARDGRVAAFGDAGFYGDTRRKLVRTVAMAVTPTGAGYWLLGARGRVFAFGDASDLGGAGGTGGRFVGMAATPTGAGYRLFGADGRVVSFGDATDLGGAPLTGAVGGAAHGHGGYWVASATGRVSAIGDAPHMGDLKGVALESPVVSLAATPTGAGYWLVTATGRVYPFGDAA